MSSNPKSAGGRAATGSAAHSGNVPQPGGVEPCADGDLVAVAEPGAPGDREREEVLENTLRKLLFLIEAACAYLHEYEGVQLDHSEMEGFFEVLHATAVEPLQVDL